MKIKRILTVLIGLPLVLLILMVDNVYVLDVFLAVVATIGMYEYFNAIQDFAKPMEILGYLSSVAIAFVHLFPSFDMTYLGVIIPVYVVIAFTASVFTNMKYNVIDIGMTLLGACYISLNLMSIALMNGGLQNKVYLGYIIIASWGTDIFAYLVGNLFKLGKHKFSKISPNKTIEGCIGGAIGAVVLSIIYTLACNYIFVGTISWVAYAGLTLVFSILSQIGDFAASSIKRYTGIKDFGDLIPGHGGVLDRVDSVIFVAPFAYLLYMIIL